MDSDVGCVEVEVSEGVGQKGLKSGVDWDGCSATEGGYGVGVDVV